MLHAMKKAIKGILNVRRAKQRGAEIKAEARHVDKTTIAAGLLQLGQGPGDVVMRHSSLKSLGYVDGGALTVLMAVYEAISPGGSICRADLLHARRHRYLIPAS